ncbi:RsfA family transcriptional regulator [Bacillus infantis]|uniref:RsfA family transcriptional regulator n=1 Tax=Bacillus infantis TaxID=324767 RepID=UPI001CD5B0FC|nr:RsfA family transcriptional regulator [Bacillus infantis]MCA1037515.1 RsfA family transcriptional regulator [Bacillus infantis]HER2025518.1 hypothetical protein [Streptococcus pyogenes]
MRTRADAWSKEEDTILTDTILSYIREGRTQLQAFEDVSRRIGRTASACGFRWNSEVRKQHLDEIALAKRIKYENSLSPHETNKEQLPLSTYELSIIINSVTRLYEKLNFADNTAKRSNLEKKLKDLKSEHEKLLLRRQELVCKIKQLL